MIVEFHPVAAEEVAESASYYEQQIVGLGEAFIAELQRTIKRIQEQPEIGLRVRQHFRSFVLARFPFSLVYTVEPERIVIVAVAHNRRRPGYWVSRTTL